MSNLGLAQDIGHPVLVELPRFALTKAVPPAVRSSRSRDRVFTGSSTTPPRADGRLRQNDARGGMVPPTARGAIVAWLSLDMDDNEPGVSTPPVTQRKLRP